MNNEGTTIRDVEVRTWPETSEVYIIDPTKATVLAHYPLVDPAPGKVADLSASYEERCQRAMKETEASQEFLRKYFEVEPSLHIKLRPVQSVRQIVDQMLQVHGFSLEETSPENIGVMIDRLETCDIYTLFNLTADWFDVVERRYPAGSSLRSGLEWTTRADPDKSCLFHYLSQGIEDPSSATESQHEVAYEYFKSLVDCDPQEFNFGNVIRWVYYHRTEFADRTRFDLSALTLMR